MSLIRPTSARQAVEAYAQTPGALPLAGGTDVMVAWNAGLLNHRTVLDLSAVEQWGGIHPGKGSLRIGAMATHSEIQADPIVLRDFFLLAKSCRTVGAAQIQNRGTLGGNIANASPAGDTFPALAVYEARVLAVCSQGWREIPFLEVFIGVKKTSLRPAELIEAVEIDFLSRQPARQFFRKVGTRLAQAISKTVAAGLLWLDCSGRVEEMRFALGSMAPTVRRLKAAENFVRGKKLTKDVIEQTVGLLNRDVSPIDDLRSNQEYRLQVSRNLLKGFLEG
jgi:CO/xanthine dehydrogenase FAD-binding subunit